MEKHMQKNPILVNQHTDLICSYLINYTDLK